MKQIKGWWDDGLSPHLEISLPDGEQFDVVVDSGFNGTLMLPLRRLKKLRLEKGSYIYNRLADGSVIRTPTYIGEILWFGQKAQVLIQANDADEGLLGMELFQGCKVELDLDADVVIFRKKSVRRR